jgi:hypothetical protein
MSRRGCSLPASASCFDPHCASISNRSGQVADYTQPQGFCVATATQSSMDAILFDNACTRIMRYAGGSRAGGVLCSAHPVCSASAHFRARVGNK